MGDEEWKNGRGCDGDVLVRMVYARDGKTRFVCGARVVISKYSSMAIYCGGSSKVCEDNWCPARRPRADMGRLRVMAEGVVEEYRPLPAHMTAGRASVYGTVEIVGRVLENGET